MAADSFFFSFFGKLDSRGVPLRAIVMIAVATAAYSMTASFDFLLGLFSFSTWILYALTAVALLILRRRHVGEPLSFRAPLGIVPPAIVIATSFIMIIGTVMDATLRALVGAGMVALIAGVYLVWCQSMPDPEALNLSIKS